MDINQAYGLAVQHHQAGRHQEAEAIYRAILDVIPGNPDVSHSLGVLAMQTARPDMAIPLLDAAYRAHPDEPRFRSTLARALAVASSHAWNAGNHAEAIRLGEDACRLEPAQSDPPLRLGSMHQELGNLTEAIRHYRTVLSLNPGDLTALRNLAAALHGQGDLREAIAVQRRISALTGSPADHSAILMLSNLLPDVSIEEQGREIESWRQAHGRTKPSAGGFTNTAEPGRRLRIGYVSSLLDTIEWPMTTLWLSMMPVILHHDPAAFEVFIYGGAHQRATLDPVWPRIAGWRDIGHLDDPAASALIRNDAIDILVCPIGHSDRDRMTLFTHRPAPIQVSHYALMSSGIDAMDYMVVDDSLHPPSSREILGEQAAYLPHFLAMQPLDWAPEVSPLPALAEGGTITFGCFNVRNKVNDRALACFARIMSRLPGSRLVLKCRSDGYASPASRRAVETVFLGHGIDVSRLGYLPTRADTLGHMADYQRIDFALDTFPFPGCLTTYDALWMGVPTVTMDGDRITRRIGQALLHAAGQDHLIARDEDDYVAKVLAVVADLPALAALRRELRPALRRSRLCDGAAFTRDLEKAYRDMWQRWCAAPG